MSVTHPRGFTAAGVEAGLKTSGGKDVALVVNQGPNFDSASVFTANRCKANPILWSQEVVKDGTGETGTKGRPIINRGPHAHIAQMVGPAAVARCQTSLTSAADQQAAEQGGTFARRPLGGGNGAIVSQALLDRFNALPADVRWKAVFDEHLTRLRGIHRFARVGAAWLLLARVDLAVPPTIGPGIDGMV